MPNKSLFSYGTAKPELEFHNIWNETRQTYELFSVKQIVDSVNRMMEKILAQKQVNRKVYIEEDIYLENVKKFYKGKKVVLSA